MNFNITDNEYWWGGRVHDGVCMPIDGDSVYTADLFDTLNAVLKIGTAESLNTQIGYMAVNALIGTKDNPGFAYSMKVAGATTFNFVTASPADCFIVN